jgi:hypothetical protein
MSITTTPIVPSKLAAAELPLTGYASPRPSSHDPKRFPASLVKERNGIDAEEPFWREYEADASDR